MGGSVVRKRGSTVQLDAKQKVLLAIYAEYQKDIPDMSLITFENLDMDCKAFYVALDKLENEGLITGTKLHFRTGYPYPNAAITIFIKMTREGIVFVEEKLDIQRALSGREKLEILHQKFGKLGWEALSDFTAKVLVEVSKQIIT